MASPSPPGLESRGQKLWRAITAERELGPAGVELLLEAARIADRLDRVDAMLRDPETVWLEVMAKNDGEIHVLVVNSLLAEARQHALALKQLLSELRQQSPGNSADGGGDAVEKLRARRAAARPPAPEG